MIFRKHICSIFQETIFRWEVHCSLGYKRIWKWNANGDISPHASLNSQSKSGNADNTVGHIFNRNEYLPTRLHPVYKSLKTPVRFCFKYLSWNSANPHIHASNPNSTGDKLVQQWSSHSALRSKIWKIYYDHYF